MTNSTRDHGDEGDDLYDALGVTSRATGEDITRAYRRLAREHHPDTNPRAERERFSDLTDAYDVLRDPTRRRAYDRTRTARAGAARAAAGVRIPVRRVKPTERLHPTGPADNTQPHDDPRPEHGEIDLPLSFDQAALGTTVTMPVDTDVLCPACAGGGTETTGPTTCPDCDGEGSTERQSGGLRIRYECPHCDGSGKARAQRCSHCGGRGQVREVHEVTVRVPAGVDNGTRLRFNLPTVTEHREMFAVVSVADHPFFGRHGFDLTLRLPVTLSEAALGCVATVPTLRGAVAIRIPPGTPYGRTLRARGHGIPSGPTPGDLLITIDIVIPAELNERQRAALEAFGDATESPRKHFESGDPSSPLQP